MDYCVVVKVRKLLTCVLNLGGPWVGCPCGLCYEVVLLLYTISVRTCVSLCCCSTVVCGLRSFILGTVRFTSWGVCVWVIK
jgi:hypothetical protein